MPEFRRYPLRVEQSKLDGWWFVFVDALPELVVFGPNYEDLLGRLKRAARNVFRARGETVTDIEITTVESGEAAMALWVIPGGKTGVMGAPLNRAITIAIDHTPLPTNLCAFSSQFRHSALNARRWSLGSQVRHQTHWTGISHVPVLPVRPSRILVATD